jgi:hypothetical protein
MHDSFLSSNLILMPGIKLSAQLKFQFNLKTKKTIMKKLVLIALCLVGASNIKASRIVEIYRSGGFFGYYGDIKQTFMGWIGNEQWWILECHDWGFTQCKLRPSAGRTQKQLEIEEIENTQLSNLMTSIETDEINNGNTNGEQTKHYQSTLSDGSVVDIYLTISWSPDTEHSGDTKFTARITNSEE